jgi:hypothetical protein
MGESKRDKLVALYNDLYAKNMLYLVIGNCISDDTYALCATIEEKRKQYRISMDVLENLELVIRYTNIPKDEQPKILDEVDKSLKLLKKEYREL